MDTKGDTKSGMTTVAATSGPEAATMKSQQQQLRRLQLNLHVICKYVANEIANKKLVSYTTLKSHYRVVALNLTTTDVKPLLRLFHTMMSSGTDEDFLNLVTAGQKVPKGTWYIVRVEDAPTKAATPLFFGEDGSLVPGEHTPEQVLCQQIKLQIDASAEHSTELTKFVNDLNAEIEKLDRKRKAMRQWRDDEQRREIQLTETLRAISGEKPV